MEFADFAKNIIEEIARVEEIPYEELVEPFVVEDTLIGQVKTSIIRR